ncbi:MAG: mannose-1-phosphate guanylyltransferase/mannose-6-phosphate isomerase [Desulfobulbaceae bacterium]|nr:MAG: mannose-1-phosphate guanylyltransferase/mannose-6-phosphate isomerase [Desulfobulbaceae bacterium]
MKKILIPVILCGGSGTRLWPLSRELYPKQLLALAGERSMLQETMLRLAALEDQGRPIVICNEAHRFLVAEQLRQIECRATILLEPEGKNTAPALAVAAFQALHEADEPLLLVLPADHVISDPQALIRSVRIGEQYAEQGKLLTFGVVPSRPETGYGYIRAGALLDDSGTQVFTVDEFVEKPDQATATTYLESPYYYWNSGMFLFAASRYLDELSKHAPDMVEACRTSWQMGRQDLDFYRLDRHAFAESPADSIDYAVMEKTSAAVVIPLAAGWNDVGSWSALWEIGSQDQDGNVTSGDVLLKDTSNSFLYSSSRLLATIGLDDMVVVETPDAVLVAPKDKVQQVKEIVKRLKSEARAEISVHKKVYRPWGTFESIDSADRYQVKRITVLPGAQLSLQMHHHRAEHWVVVRGTAKITRGNEVFTLTENQSTYIPLGETHRLENPGKIPLELIEVQSGSYLGEDDIVRYDDTYGR